MHTKVAEGLHFHYMEHTGNVQMWHNGRQVKPMEMAGGGSRTFFKVGAYFVKAEYAHKGYETQCKDEAFVWPKIQNQDRQFFTRLLACSDMTDDTVHWTMYPWYNLRMHDDHGFLYEACQNKVDRLCDKYDIDDVAPFINVNWFIHKGKPLIVDCGCAGGGSL